jgi:hypothetical protein
MNQKPKRKYQAPRLQSLQPGKDQPVLLACTNQFDCEPEAGFPCCKPSVDECQFC